MIGAEPRAWMMFGAVGTVWLLFAHANLRRRLAWLTPILCGPQGHRIHHSDRARHQNKNFAQYFTVYDALFGTY